MSGEMDYDDDFDLRYDAEPVMPSECDWGWCRGEAVAYRDDSPDQSDPLPVCQLHVDHRPDAATSTCREDGSPWPCEVERRARRTLAEVQAERTRDATKPYPVEVAEQSVDLTPGVVWTDAQLAVVRDLTARAYKAEAAIKRVEALVYESGRDLSDVDPDDLNDAARAQHMANISLHTKLCLALWGSR